MHPFLHRISSDLLHFIAPALCPACDALLERSERGYCNACRSSLDPAPFPRDIFAEVAGHFPGEELALSAIGSLYSFDPESPVRRLVHALKYKGCYALGVEMGRDLGRALKVFREFEDIEMVIPVPLHRARLRERGYNQAEAIARGVSEAMKHLTIAQALLRTRHTISQTTLDAYARHRNVREVFRVAGEVTGMTVLLCDDVCTTGATLNACAERLLLAGAKRVVAATVAKDGEK